MAHHRDPRDREPRRNLPGHPRPLPQQIQDPAAGRVSQRPPQPGGAFLHPAAAQRHDLTAHTCNLSITYRPTGRPRPRRPSPDPLQQAGPLPAPTTGGIVTTTPAVFTLKREPELPGQTVVVIGGSSGIGLETARRARAEGADVILTG